MEAKPTSPTRTKATWKPRVDDTDPAFFAEGDATLLLLDTGRDASFREPGRAPVAELPYQPLEGTGLTGDTGPGALRELPLLSADELPEGLEFGYRIVGGYDANAVQVRWRVPADLAGKDGAPVALRWAALKTFTGLQVKYPLPNKRPPLVFALADEDAYVYCDEPVCKECTFRCKQGLVLYGAFAGVGIVRVPLSPNSAETERV